MTPETAFAEAMKYDNRPNPYPFFDELRKTPVAHVGNGIYVVTGYRELMTLAHDPRISSDTRRLKARAAANPGSEPDPLEAYGEHGNMITSDPPDHVDCALASATATSSSWKRPARTRCVGCDSTPCLDMQSKL